MAIRPNLTITCGFLFAHAIKHMLCFGTSFLCAEKGGKDAGSFVGFHEEKTGGSVITRTNHTIRAAAQDRIPIERFLSDKIMTTQTPGASGPLLYGRRFKKIPYPPIFMKRKSAHSLGVRGRSSRRRFCFLLSPRTKKVAAQSITFWVGLRSLCADISQQKSGLPATFFLHTKKEGKDVPRGVPLGIPRQLAGFLFRKAGGRADAQTRLYTKRAAARGLGGYKIIDLYYSHPPCDS